jgi:hypothetical protein
MRGAGHRSGGVIRPEDVPAPPGPALGYVRADPTPDQVELLGLGVMVTVLERMTPAERRRALAYLADRFGGDA